MKPRIKVIQPLGFCYGVKRAVNLAREVLENNPGKRIYSLGEIIHNKDAVRELSQKGLIVKNNLKGIKKGDILIISSHGVSPAVLKKAAHLGVKIVNATCPNVITSQRLCERLKRKGYFVVIVGDRRHREIEALRGFAGNKSVVVRDEGEARAKKINGRRIGVVIQTTQPRKNLIDVLKGLAGRNYIELRALNTICNDTSMRQKAALSLSKNVDTIFVIGGRHSANTRRLFELCRKVSRRCYHVENDRGVEAAKLRNAKRIGIVSGASTPNWIIKKVIKKISEATLDKRAVK